PCTCTPRPKEESYASHALAVGACRRLGYLDLLTYLCLHVWQTPGLEGSMAHIRPVCEGRRDAQRRRNAGGGCGEKKKGSTSLSVSIQRTMHMVHNAGATH